MLTPALPVVPVTNLRYVMMMVRKWEKAMTVMIATMMIKITMIIMTLGLSGYHGRGLEAILGECAARGNFIHSLNSKDLERLGLYFSSDNWKSSSYVYIGQLGLYCKIILERQRSERVTFFK